MHKKSPPTHSPINNFQIIDALLQALQSRFGCSGFREQVTFFSAALMASGDGTPPL
jgi:hypothetical protein